MARDLDTICLKCLEKDPERRYPSAAALANDVERWLRHEPIRARPVSTAERVRKWVRRKPAWAALILTLAILAGSYSADALRLLLARPATTAPIPRLTLPGVPSQAEIDRPLSAYEAFVTIDVALPAVIGQGVA